MNKEKNEKKLPDSRQDCEIWMESREWVTVGFINERMGEGVA